MPIPTIASAPKLRAFRHYAPHRIRSQPHAQPVVAAVTTHLNLEAEIGGYEAHGQGSRIDGVYSSIARMLGAIPEEIAIKRARSLGATRSMHT